MNDLRKLTRIILIGLGAYVLLRIAASLFLAIPFFFASIFSGNVKDGLGIISVLFGIFYAILIIYFCFYKADFWAEKIVGSDEPVETGVWWVPFAFRLTAVFCGILYLYWIVPRIISTVHAYFVMRDSGSFPAFRGQLEWDQILSWVVLLSLGIYLLCGAPHFVRWQVKKTLEQCRRLQQGDTPTEEEVVS